MTELEEKKINQLFQFFVNNGFDHTVEEISVSLKITPKTLYNRYQNKTNMIFETLTYWQKLVVQRINEKTIYCNNSIEALIILICEIELCRQTETSFFHFKKDDLLGDDQYGNSEWENCLISIISNDKYQSFDKRINIETFVKYFFTNLLFYLSKRNLFIETIHYILQPLLTESGKEKFNEVDFETLLIGQK